MPAALTATAKPLARAEMVTTGRDLLDRVALVVTGARFAQYYTVPITYWVELVRDHTARESRRLRRVTDDARNGGRSRT